MNTPSSATETGQIVIAKWAQERARATVRSAIEGYKTALGLGGIVSSASPGSRGTVQVPLADNVTLLLDPAGYLTFLEATEFHLQLKRGADVVPIDLADTSAEADHHPYSQEPCFTVSSEGMPAVLRAIFAQHAPLKVEVA